jgi:hypothetical protein
MTDLEDILGIMGVILIIGLIGFAIFCCIGYCYAAYMLYKSVGTPDWAMVGTLGFIIISMSGILSYKKKN